MPSLSDRHFLLSSRRYRVQSSIAFPYELWHLLYCFPIGAGENTMTDKKDVWQGTLALMVLKTLQSMGPLHGYGIARRIEQTSGDLLSVNYGTLYPALLKLEQEGYISSEWGVSDNNRKAKYYKLTRAGRKQLESEAREWEQTTEILARFLSPERES
jgi:PadR family transcriptional regulator PadR